LLHGYVYARWPYLYIGIGMGEHWLARLFMPIAKLFSSNSSGNQEGTFAENYHGKVITQEAARQIVTVREPIQLRNLEKVIPYRRAKDILLKNPDHIVALECPCRAARADPCLPLEVCLIVGEPFAGFVREHHPRRSRWISSTEAVDILRAEHERGHVHHAFFKDAMLDRFYAICNCCSCCCGAMEAMRNGTPMLTSSGYVSQVDAELCLACGLCEAQCPFHAIRMLNESVQVDERRCMGCGVCVACCDLGAMSLRRDPSKGAPLEIYELLATAAGAGSISPEARE
jgi:ferredoxin